MASLWRWMKATQGSLFAFAILLPLGFLSMGLQGYAIYYPVAPVLMLWYPPPSAWRGSWVWPSLIAAGLVWPFAFLIAGEVNRRLVRHGSPRGLRRLAYIGILWLWALLVWIWLLEQAQDVV